MRIMHVVPSFGFGGMEKVICSVISHTSEMYDHVILSLDGEHSALSWIKGKDQNTIDFFKSNVRVKFFNDLYNALKSVNPDLLMTYNWGGTDAIWLGKIAGIKKIIHSEHGFNYDESKYTSLKRDIIRLILYNMSSKIIVVSKNLKDEIQKTYHVRKNKISFIPNGVDQDCYSPDIIERNRIRRSLGFEDNHIVIGFSGRLDPVKNLKYMLEIFSSCVEKESRFRLLIVGDGPERSHIETLCRQNKVERNVILTGQKDQVVPYLRAMDLFLLTSLSEQMPLTILEAMSVGLPVVATKVGEIPQIIQNEKDGLLIDLDERPENVAIAIRALTYDQKLASMGNSARGKIISGFQEKVMLQKYADTFDSMLIE